MAQNDHKGEKNMKNIDVHILHLSDLHIQNESTDTRGNAFYSNALRKLINDIEKQTKDKEDLIIVVSGDIIDQGDYGRNFDAAVSFFSDLNKRIGRKIKDIFIVPGNHDKCRNPLDNYISKGHSQEGIDPEASKEWEMHLPAFKKYIELVNEIYKIFGKQESVINTFGVYVVKANGMNICVLAIDSACCSFSKNDRRKLRVGRYQIMELSKKYKQICNQYAAANDPIELTIAVTHFPLNWLTSDEEELCNNYFLADDFLNVDIVMCGHVHDFSAVNYYNHKHSLLTLVTGIGWGVAEPGEAKDIHRYSIYTINRFYNSCEIVMRKTKINGDFDWDYSVYLGERELKDGKLRYPLRMKECNSFIRINAPVSMEAKSLFFDDTLISAIPKVTKAMAAFSDNMARLLDMYRRDFLEKIHKENQIKESDCITEDEKMRLAQDYNEIEQSLYSDQEVTDEIKEKYFTTEYTLNSFLAFLNEICETTIQELKECFTPEVILRAHFRWHNFPVDKKAEQDKYRMLCQCSNDQNQQCVGGMQTVPWDGMIKQAFETGEPIIYSANKKYNPIKTTWDEFITMVPKFRDYAYDVRVRKGQTFARPIITFGLSLKEAKSRNDTMCMCLLAYLRFDELVGQMIDEYIRSFNIDVKRFLPEIRKIMSNAPRREYSHV